MLTGFDMIMESDRDLISMRLKFLSGILLPGVFQNNIHARNRLKLVIKNTGVTIIQNKTVFEM